MPSGPLYPAAATAPTFTDFGGIVEWANTCLKYLEPEALLQPARTSSRLK